MFITGKHSTNCLPDGQSVHRGRYHFVALWLMAAIAGSLVGIGCGSIYHRTRAELPPEPPAELQLRIAEARRAESTALQAGRILRDHLARGVLDEIIQEDFDRLDVTASDLDRRVLAASDATARCSNPADAASEVERLRHRADSLLGFVQANRHVADSARLERLDALLREFGT